MTKFCFLSIVLCFLFSCQKNQEISSTSKVTNETPQIKTSAQPKQNEITALETHHQKESDSHSTKTNQLKSLAGKHGLTLQWISWDQPGIVNFKPIGENRYEISGSQLLGKDYLTIEGEITQITPLELHFDGIIKHLSSGNDRATECVKKGPQIFLSTKNRKYWRMQDMTNCKGSVTDYIDIYF